MGTVLSESDIAEELAKLPGWERDGGLIRARFRAANFLAAIALVDEVARRAEAANHHPDIDIRYDRVTFVLSTHSEGGLTRKDFSLAREISDVAAALSAGADH